MKKNWIKCTILLFSIWMILSGYFEIKYIFVGLGTAAVVSACCVPMMHVKGRDGKIYSLFDISIVNFFAYSFWLVKEVAMASYHVASCVIQPDMQVNPQMITFRCKYENPIAITLLINSIILTPGTVTVDVREKGTVFVVHALTEKSADSLLEGKMQERIGKLFGEAVTIEQGGPL